MNSEASRRSERARLEIVNRAVMAADRVLMDETDSTVEMLMYLTAEVARRFAEKTSMMAMVEVNREDLRQELNLKE